MKKVKVQLRTIMAGPDGGGRPGDVIEVGEKKASELIKGRFARPYDEAAEAAQDKSGQEGEGR